MNNKSHASLALSATALIFMIGSSTPTPAQDNTKSGIEKWRPKDGIYVTAGKDLAERCGESTEFVVELQERSLGGNEWNCRVDRVVEVTSDALRLNLTCNDYNLAEYLDNHDPNPYDKKFKEIVTLRKVDEKSFFVRKTLNGRFRIPEWRAVYCPLEAQQAYREAKVRDLKEAERKAATRSSEPKAAKW